MTLNQAGFALLALVATLGLLWVLRGNRKARKSPAIPQVANRSESDRLDYLRRSGLYWGVRIRFREGQPVCPQARDLDDQEFPLDEAPRLPLPGCDLDCQCHYQPLLEHRDGKVRRLHHDRRSILRYEPDKKNRRQVPTRRE